MIMATLCAENVMKRKFYGDSEFILPPVDLLAVKSVKQSNIHLHNFTGSHIKIEPYCCTWQ